MIEISSIVHEATTIHPVYKGRNSSQWNHAISEGVAPYQIQKVICTTEVNDRVDIPLDRALRGVPLDTKLCAVFRLLMPTIRKHREWLRHVDSDIADLIVRELSGFDDKGRTMVALAEAVPFWKSIIRPRILRSFTTLNRKTASRYAKALIEESDQVNHKPCVSMGTLYSASPNVETQRLFH